jgi:hypothetical protein
LPAALALLLVLVPEDEHPASATPAANITVVAVAILATRDFIIATPLIGDERTLTEHLQNVYTEDVQ